MTTIPATWMRGGTSKCWVFLASDLQVPGRTVDEVLLSLFGSPDSRQLDGIGGATSTTSKAVILSRSTDAAVDVEYTFAQVGIDENVVDWGSNCGNCSAVVAPWAVRAGWVDVTGETTRVRVLNTNTKQLMVQSVATREGALDDTPTTTIPGVARPAARVDLGFVSPAGRSTGTFLPTGNAVDTLSVGDDRIEASLVDAGAPVAIVRGADVGLIGSETPDAIDGQPDLLSRLDQIRRAAAVAMGLAASPQLAARAVPKLALVAPADEGQRALGANAVVLMMSMGRVHPALPITGSVAITLAARTHATIASEIATAPTPTVTGDEFGMLTPAGLVTTAYSVQDGKPVVAAVRTYRLLVSAEIPLPPS